MSGERSDHSPVIAIPSPVPPWLAMCLFLAVTGLFATGVFLLSERYRQAVRLDYLLSDAEQLASTFEIMRNADALPGTAVAGVQPEPLGRASAHAGKHTLAGGAPTGRIDELARREWGGGAAQLVIDSPAREGGRGLDGFQRRALAALRRDPGQPFHELSLESGALRFAKALHAEPVCSSCHDDASRTSGRRFAPGEVLGLQEVTLPTSLVDGKQAQWSLAGRDLLRFLMACFSVITLLLAALLRRNRVASDSALALARSESLARAHAEAAGRIAQDSAARLRAVFGSVADAIITADETGTIESANHAAETIFGYPAEALVGRNLATLMRRGDAARHDGYLRDYLHTGKRSIIGLGREVIGLRASGEAFPLELSVSEAVLDGRRLFTGILRDISAQRANAQRLLEQQAMNAAILESGLDAIITVDAQGRVREFNAAAVRIFGHSREHALGRPIADLIIPERLREPHRKGMARYLLTGESRVMDTRVEVPALRGDGSEFPCELAITGISLDSQRLFTATVRDISDRKQAESELVAAREKAEFASRAKSDFVAMISHEIRTPLNAVIGSLNVLDGMDLAADQRRFVQTSRHAADTLISIINGILDFSKSEAGKMVLETEPFDLRALVESVGELLAGRAAEKAIYLNLDLADDVPRHVVGDAGKIRQILLNLLQNAVKFTETGGIDVSVTSLPSAGASVCGLRFTVQDSGCGIPADVQGRLFEEFWTSGKHSGYHTPGTGLGLPICERLVALMGGAISFTSAEPEGSVFWFDLQLQLPDPVAIATMQARTARTGAALVGPLPQFRGLALLAEDNQANQLVGKALLARFGLQVDIAADGFEAVQALRERQYDIVFMDIGMPNMGGVEAARLIRAQYRDSLRGPIVAATAQVFQGAREKLLAQGFDEYLPKPVDRNELAELLSRWLPPAAPASALPAPTRLATGAVSSPMLDDAVIGQLAADLDRDTLVRVLRLFLSDLDHRTESIASALGDSDGARLAREAHALKSSAGTVGAVQLARFLAALESCTVEERGSAERLENLRRLALRSRAALEQFLAGLPD